jgi:hypothetical protein
MAENQKKTVFVEGLLQRADECSPFAILVLLSIGPACMGQGARIVRDTLARLYPRERIYARND